MLLMLFSYVVLRLLLPTGDFQSVGCDLSCFKSYFFLLLFVVVVVECSFWFVPAIGDLCLAQRR